mgnify:CR=1 FL=1
MYADRYIDIVQDTIRKAWDEQKDIIAQAAQLIRTALETKHSVYIFGCSHAGILAEEVFFRTGGLAVLNPIFFPGFMLNTRPITMTSQLERVDGLGKIILQQNNLKEGDVLIILEAMKMETNVLATASGKIAKINAKEGSQVVAGELIAVIE